MALPDALAAIDIGTNSVHMLIARISANGRFEVLTRQKEMVRLGSGKGEMKRLEPAAIDRGIAALTRCRSLAQSFDAQIHAVATSAVREALNADEFISRAREEAGVEVEVIPGHEEARLIQLGVLQALPIFDKPMVLLDVGGGSTEVLFGKSGTVQYARSIKLGSLRMTDKFFPAGEVVGDAVERCRQYVEARLAPMAHETSTFPHEVAVASSGTAEALAVMAYTRRKGSVPQKLNAATFAVSELTATVDELGAARTVAERRKIAGVDSGRADILLAGAIVLEQVCLALGIDELTISEYALREGVLLDALDRAGGGPLHHLSDLRRSSVFHLMELCDDDPEHSLQVAKIVMQLHDALGERLGLGDGERELLEAAALLSNVGLFIAHSGHHKHTYYVIRNTDHLMGFTDSEIELVAQIARYHRKSAPSEEKHPEFASLQKSDRAVVRAASSLLRIAIGIDRSHDGAVERVVVQDQGSAIRIELRGAPGADLALEQYSAETRSQGLAAILGATISVEVGEEFADEVAED
ncbi:MAG: Ppx/GppA phosphatase family protein [Microthrixaceae bacterium]